MASSNARPTVYPASCEPCRKRKCRCNRVKPCANCELRGISDQCFVKIPRIEGRRVNPGQSSPPPPFQSSTNQTNSDTADASTASETHVVDLERRRASTSTEAITPLINDQEEEISAVSSLLINRHSMNSQPQVPVAYREVSRHLPSTTLCLELVAFYFYELLPEVSFVSETKFYSKIVDFCHEKVSLPQQQVALLFWILAYSALIAPPKHSLRSTFIDLEKAALQWKEVAWSYQLSLHGMTKVDRQDELIGVALCVMEGMWWTYKGNFEANWDSTGVAIRKGIALRIFTDQARNRARNQGNDTSGIILLCPLVQKILVMDRWIAFSDLRPLGIQPSDVTISLPGTGASLRAEIEQIQIELLESAQKLLMDFERNRVDRQELNSQLETLLHSINTHCTNVIARYKAATSVQITSQDCTRMDSSRHASILFSWLASVSFIGCATATRLASRMPACVQLSVNWANNIMKLVPCLTALHLDGTQALRRSRIANHLFYALRSVFHALEKSRLTEFHLSLSSSSDWTNSFEGDEWCYTVSDIIRNQFESSVKLLTYLKEANCKTAELAITLVNKVLAQNPEFAVKLGVEAKEETNRVIARRSHGRRVTTPAAGGGGGGGVAAITPPPPASERPANDFLWNFPDLETLNQQDIDAFISNFVNLS